MISKIIVFLQKYFQGKLAVRKFIPGIAWFFILLVLLCIPGRDIPNTGSWFELIYFDKWVHTGLFGLLGFLFISPVFASSLIVKKKWIYAFVIVVLISGWGFLTEEIQGHFIEGRSFDPFDWMADTLGTLLALILSKYYFLDKPAQLNGKRK